MFVGWKQGVIPHISTIFQQNYGYLITHTPENKDDFKLLLKRVLCSVMTL